MSRVEQTTDDEAEQAVIRGEIQKVLNSRRALLREMAVKGQSFYGRFAPEKSAA